MEKTMAVAYEEVPQSGTYDPCGSGEVVSMYSQTCQFYTSVVSAAILPTKIIVSDGVFFEIDKM